LFVKFQHTRNIRVLQVGIEYSMNDLISKVISYRSLICDNMEKFDPKSYQKPDKIEKTRIKDISTRIAI